MITFDFFHSEQLDDVYSFFKEQMQNLVQYGFDAEDGEWNVETYHQKHHFLEYLTKDNIIIYLAFDEAKVVGYLEIHCDFSHKVANIWWILIDDSYKRLGIARKMYQNAENFLKQKNIYVLKAMVLQKNIISVRFH